MTKKYILKPGKHQFAPNSAAVHDNDNITDEEAAWYLEKYPHIAPLFASRPSEGDHYAKGQNIGTKMKKRKRTIKKITPDSGGREVAI